MEIDKSYLIEALENFADLLELKRENKFKVEAYRKAANAIRQYEGNFIEDLMNEKKKIPGVGESIKNFISEIITNGKSLQLENLKKFFPETLFELFKIKGLGPVKIANLYYELGVDSLAALKLACQRDAISKLKGFSEKFQNEILEQILKLETSNKAILLPEALELKDKFLNAFKLFFSEENIEPTGKTFRGDEIFDRLEFLSLKEYDMNFEKFLKDFGFKNIIFQSDNFIDWKTKRINVPKTVCWLENNFQFIIYHLKNYDQINYLRFILSCDKNFLSQLKVYEEFTSEEELFAKNNLPYIIPEAREEKFFELKNDLITKANEIINFGDLKGLIHFHTTSSDGKNTLEEMAEYGCSLGYEYFVVCDHSKSAFYAQGLDEDKVEKQREQIRRLSSRYKILSGIEADILSDGSLDYSEDFLKTFDFVIASIHSRFSMSEEEMTNRIIKAVENPNVDALGHISGRLLLMREPYKINRTKIIEACAKNNVAIEINSTPFRLDIDWRNLYFARNIGCKFLITPDAHSIAEIKNNDYGIMMARKALIEKSEILNFLNYENFVNYIAAKRSVKK